MPDPYDERLYYDIGYGKIRTITKQVEKYLTEGLARDKKNAK